MRVFDNLYLDNATTPTNTTSQAIEMGDNNALQVAATLIAGGTGTITVDGSNDLTNWVAIVGTITLSASGPAFTSAVYTAIAWRYTRIRAVAGASDALINVDVHTQKL